MKKSIVKTSLLIGLSTLFTACGSNHTPTSQLQSAPQSNLPNTPPKNEQMHNNSEGNKQEVPSPMPPSSNEEDKPVPPTSLPNKEQNPSQAENGSDTNVDTNPNESQRENNTTGNNTPIDQSNEMNLDHTQNHHQMPPAQIQNNTESNSKKLNEESLKAYWSGHQCDSYGSCIDNEEKPDKVTINKSLNNETQVSTISLQIGENTSAENDYKFILLAENNSGIVYYGYRSDTVNNSQKLYEIITAENTQHTNQKDIPTNYQASYNKNDGFLYITSSESNNAHKPQYANVSLIYTDGKATGTITDKNTSQILFNIEGIKNTSFISRLKISPTEHNHHINKEDIGTFSIFFYDSIKANNDRKYILGEGAGKNWRGILAAEKQAPSTTTSGK